MKRLPLVFAAALFAAATASAQDWAKARIDKSSRHYEYVKIKHGNREVNAFITFPEVRTKATAMVVIHENQGLTDWARSVTDQLAEAGYVAIAPDFLSGMGPNGGGTPAFPDREAVSRAFGELRQKPEQVTADLNAVVDYVAKLPASNGKVVVGGFCWGGGQTFRYATHHKDIKAALVFYGDSPADADIPKITAPVYGFYAENDARINAALPKTQELMKAAGKTYDVVIYKGAGHGFMRAGEAPPPAADADQKAKDNYAANKQAREEAWTRVKAILAKI